MWRRGTGVVIGVGRAGVGAEEGWMWERGGERKLLGGEDSSKTATGMQINNY